MKTKFLSKDTLKICIILAIASILRLWNLANVPPSLTPDEASLGYNAYSILKTGKDEYGEAFPIIFKSFGDYKPGFYVYLTVPFVAVMGLNEWSVRLPSALSGIAAVYLLYKISSLLFVPKTKYNKIYPLIPYTSSLILALTPWHIHFSRGAWEINVSLTLTLLGIYFFLIALKKPWYLLASSFFFALTFITYQGAKLSTFFVLVTLFLMYFDDVKMLMRKNIGLVTSSFFVGLLISLPILLSFFGDQAGRLKVFSVFSYPRPGGYLQGFLDQGQENVDTFSYYLFHSEAGNFTRGVLGRWFNHYSGRFLFYEGDWQNPKHTAPYHGVLTNFDLLLFVLGIYYMARNIKKKSIIFLGLWLLFAPLPAALSRDAIHAVRSYTMVIPLVLVLSFGLSWLISFVQSFSHFIYRFAATSLFLILYSLSYIYFLDMYFVHMPIQSAKYWDYGFREVISIIKPIQRDFSTIKIQQSFAQPYIYVLFYTEYDPATYQKQAHLTSSEYKDDVGYITKVDNIEFTGINWPENRGESGTLFVGDDIRIPPQDSKDPSLFITHGIVSYPDGSNAYRIVEVK